MFTLFFSLIAFSLGLTLIFISTPISLGFWVLLLSLFVSVFCGSFFISWFGFTVFLIYIGGILVIFSYFTAIQPNQDINLSKPAFYWWVVYQLIPVNCYCFTLDLFCSSNWWVTCIFHPFNLFILVILGLVLFLALIRVVKVTITSFSPLRPFN